MRGEVIGINSAIIGPSGAMSVSDLPCRRMSRDEWSSALRARDWPCRELTGISRGIVPQQGGSSSRSRSQLAR
jgi:hypothetical protein